MTFRLYTRGWGPARIVDTLNFHRSITPKYLRNTCSVKCTTARKRGIERHGQAWAENLHNAFRASENDNLAATRLLDFDDSEKDQVQDVDLLDCVRGLRHHPLENAEGEDITVRGEMSIFAKCVFWCQKNGVGCRISEAHILAAKLQSGEFTLDDGNEGAGPISPRKKMALVKALKGNGQASAGPSSAPHTPVRNTVEQDVSSDDGDDEAEPMETCTSETEEANEENDEDARSEFSDLSDISSTLNFPTH